MVERVSNIHRKRKPEGDGKFIMVTAHKCVHAHMHAHAYTHTPERAPITWPNVNTAALGVY